MKKEVVRIAVTGAGGQIAYSLLFQIAQGQLLGDKQKIALSLRDVPENQLALKGIQMELMDCAFPLLTDVQCAVDPREVFANADLVFLIGAKPRGPGMERSDLLMENAKIFVEEGAALNEVADPTVRVLVVGNPCNTNCLIAMHHAPRIPRRQFSAMMRLDHNRALAILAAKAACPVEELKRVVVWGNHSATQVPDFTQVLIRGKSVRDYIRDTRWLCQEFVETVQRRGAAIIQARGKSSAASAACAALLAMRDFLHPTREGDWFSAAVSEKNPYGIDDQLVFGFPCHSQGSGDWQIVPHLEWDMFIREKIAVTQKELIEERDCIARYL